MTYWSQAWQDEFTANILDFKKDGYYLDIGSSTPFGQSNTYFFESELNWKGICIEKNSDYNEEYKKRSCYFINDDATKVNYNSILNNLQYPPRIDYLTIDVDEFSAEALKQVPFDNYRFDIITIEHDAYRFDSLRNKEREILKKHDYMLLFPDVLVPLGCGMGPNLPFEDWWCDASVFDIEKLNKISAEKMYPDDIVAMLKKFISENGSLVR